jgi:ubiquinone/menaquinone biosynthesis C-methylase UbiE
VPKVKKTTDIQLGRQANINAYFQSQSSFWKNIYISSDVYAEIHQDRQAAVLGWIDDLALPPGSHALEIGCGAGFMAVALAQRGLRVQAIDSVEAMVELTRQHAYESGLAERLSVAVGDIYALAFEEACFDVVLAIGVIPWIGQIEPALQEMARVTKPEGVVILTADNRARMNNLLDPLLNPLFAPVKQPVKSALQRTRLRRSSLKDIGAICHSRRFIDNSLAHVGLIKTRGKTLGFGPFTLFRYSIFPKRLGITLHHRLQRLADRGAPLLRSTGAQYIVLARKSASISPKPLMSAPKAASDSMRAF